MAEITEASVAVIQETVDNVRTLSPFAAKTGIEGSIGSNPSLLRGYLMQPVSRGGKGLVSLVSRRLEYRTWKIDLSGVLFAFHPDHETQFMLRFKRNGDTWFDTQPMDASDLPIYELIERISTDSLNRATSNVQIPKNKMLGALGNPTKHTLIVQNDDLLPELPVRFQRGDIIDSRIGSWIFSIHRSILPDKDEDFEVLLLFLSDPVNPVIIDPGASATAIAIYEISDSPTGNVIVATDTLDVASPTPLTGGSKVVLGYFDDLGAGILTVNAREYLFEAPGE